MDDDVSVSFEMDDDSFDVNLSLGMAGSLGLTGFLPLRCNLPQAAATLADKTCTNCSVERTRHLPLSGVGGPQASAGGAPVTSQGGLANQFHTPGCSFDMQHAFRNWVVHELPPCVMRGRPLYFARR